MKIKRLIPLAILCALPWTVSSCLEDIDLDTGERILSVYCVLRNSPEQELELSYMAPVGGTSRPVGEGVNVSLFDGDAPVGQFTRVSETKWKMAFSPQGGHTYRLEVKVPGEETLTAETRFPIPGTRQYFYAVWGDSDTDPSLGGIAYPHGTPGYKIDAPEDQILWCYYESINQQKSPAFAGFVATDHPGADGRGESVYPLDVSSPIYKGPDGFCLGGSVYTDLFLDEPPILHEKVVRILHPTGFSRPLGDKNLLLYEVFAAPSLTQESFPTQEFVKTSLFGIGGMNKTVLYAHLVIESVSAEYDSYLSDFYFRQQDAGDFTALVYQRNFYTNITHGIGIFGASYTYWGNETYQFAPRIGVLL